MNLKEIKSLIDNKTVEVRETMGMVNHMTMNTYRFEHGTEMAFTETYLTNAPHEFTVDELLERVDVLDKEILYLKNLLAENNQAVKIKYNGEELSLTGAIAMLKSMRSRLPLLNRLSALKESRNIIAPGRYNEDTKTYVEVNRPALEVKVYREKVRAQEMEILKLQSLMDSANLTTDVAVEL